MQPQSMKLEAEECTGSKNKYLSNSLQYFQWPAIQNSLDMRDKLALTEPSPTDSQTSEAIFNAKQVSGS
jgi:hypothetical protein